MAYDPDDDADEYGVSLGRSTSFSLESNVEIVRLDTAHGQGPHLDLVSLPPGANGEKKVYLEEGYTYERMKRYLLTNWKQFADLYIRHNE